MTLRVIDLFCGCGGFSEGFRQAGFEVVLAVDNWEVALRSHEANHPEAEHWNRDILTITHEELASFRADVLIGSPPCPEFSLTNKKRPENPDTELLNKFLYLSKGFKTSVGENVVGVEKFLNGAFYQRLEALNYGLWHRRPRIFFGRFPRVPKITRNSCFFPTPRAANRNTGKFISLTLNRADKPLHVLKKYKYQLSYPWYVSKWIMGFPESYRLIGSAAERERQIGNAVCPPVARAIAESIKKHAGGGAGGS